VKEKIEFDEKTKANIMELSRLMNSLQLQIHTICQVVVNMHGKNLDDYALASDLSGMVKIEPPKKSKKPELKSV